MCVEMNVHINTNVYKCMCKYDFNAFCYSKFLDFENLYTLLTMNKGSGVFRTSRSSDASQGESSVCDFCLVWEGGENQIIESAEKTPDSEEKHNNDNINTATYKGGRLDGKFVSINVLIFQEETALKLKSLFCLGLWSLFL